ncbi:MAG TPA: hypothetical protein VN777_04400 [Terriglobales bacterium]|nr:hypothetical protein [Terriglobales bacterium]
MTSSDTALLQADWLDKRGQRETIPAARYYTTVYSFQRGRRQSESVPSGPVGA